MKLEKQCKNKKIKIIKRERNPRVEEYNEQTEEFTGSFNIRLN